MPRLTVAVDKKRREDWLVGAGPSWLGTIEPQLLRNPASQPRHQSPVIAIYPAPQGPHPLSATPPLPHA